MFYSWNVLVSQLASNSAYSSKPDAGERKLFHRVIWQYIIDLLTHGFLTDRDKPIYR